MSYVKQNNCFLLWRKFLSNSRNRHFNVLGIETSCDDTAVAIMKSDKTVLASKTYVDRRIQRELGGICPGESAKQHMKMLPVLIEQCMREAGTSGSGIDAVAVTTRPGLVIALKEGIATSIQLARKLNTPLIPVHHMRAHALSGFLASDSLQFPFATLLISGGHALICLVSSPEDFSIYGESVSGSPGECIDKVARAVGVNQIDEFQNIPTGAAVEALASRASKDGHKSYKIHMPHTLGADMNFSHIKSPFLNMASAERGKDTFSLEDFCASLQHTVAKHIAAKLHAFFEWHKKCGAKQVQHLVVSGGVAANNYIGKSVTKLAKAFGIDTIMVPPKLCADNAEMVAFTGILLANINRNQVPETIYAHARSSIGSDCRANIDPKPEVRLAAGSIHKDEKIRFFDKSYYRSQALKV